MKQTDINRALDLFEISSGRKVAVATLQQMLPDVETALFFAKAYDMDYRKLSDLIVTLFQSDLIVALNEGTHSVDLQSYIGGVVPTHLYAEGQSATFDENAPPPQGEQAP